MKRWKKILLALLALVVLAGAGLCFWQRNNIRAVYLFLSKDSISIADDLDKSRQDHLDALMKRADIQVQVQPPTTQQSNAILDGSTTPEQVKEELGISVQLEKAGSEVTQEELLNSCVAQLYSCKVDIMAQLAVLKAEALEQWRAIPKEERTATAKRELGLAGLNACYALEVEVDAQVQAILDQYRVSLQAIDGDLSILDALWEQYESEKAGEKAYYLDRYLD